LTDPEADILARLRRIYDAYNRGDFDAVMELLPADNELHLGGAQAPLRGREEIRAWMEPEALLDQRAEPVDMKVIGDKVLVSVRTSARGAGSGIEMTIDNWAVWTVRPNGELASMQVFFDHEREAAFDAAGLTP
jgi:ketosteroid isomerase-like protein